MPTPPALNRPAKTSSTSRRPTQAPKTTEGAKTDESGSVRLHITPLTPALLKVYLAPSVLPLATNISYHTVPTFPERGFGYLELPTMEAQKLKKKLNGSILKGSKIRIEEAKPEKRKSGKEEVPEKDEERPVKRAKKEKRKQGVLEGIELPDERKVKRGWTEPPTKGKAKSDKRAKKEDKMKQKESKYSKEPEVLFKTKLTPVAANALEASSKGEKSKEKKDKKKSKSKRDVVVHEFEWNTKHPSFLKSAQISNEKKPAVEYLDGKGWVDEDGNVVEPETGKARNRRVLELVDPPANSSVEKELSEKLNSKNETKSKTKTRSKVKPPTPPPAESSESSSEDSSSDESSVVSSDSDSDSSEAESQASSSSISSAVPTQPLQSITLTPPSPHEKKEVHPLEALFKRPKPGPLPLPNTSTPLRLAPIDTSFNFFGGDATGNVEDMDTSGNPPVTPFTRQDLEWRGLRSAAPTPDTAAIGRRFSFPWGNDEKDEDEDEENAEAGMELDQNTKANASLPILHEQDAEDQDEDEEEQINADANSTPLGTRASGKGKQPDGEAEESDFAKWFWENRGDNNRAWKKRRREALKAERQKENRRLPGRRVG